MNTPSYFFERAIDDVYAYPDRYLLDPQRDVSQYYPLGIEASYEEGDNLKIESTMEVPIACVGIFSVNNTFLRSDFMDTQAVDSYGLSRQALFNFVERSAAELDDPSSLLDDDSYELIQESGMSGLLHARPEEERDRLFVGGTIVYMRLSDRLLRSLLFLDAGFVRSNTFLECYLKERAQEIGAVSMGRLELAAIDRESDDAIRLPLAVLTSILMNADHLTTHPEDFERSLISGISRN